MKKTLFYLAIASLSFLACSKNDDPNSGPSGSSDVSTTVFYTDTFNVYSTDLKGGNRKLVVSEGPSNSSSNNYIYSVSYVPVANRLVYVYTERYNEPFFLRTCKLDGSDKKTIKTFPTGTNLGLVKAFSDGKIMYVIPGKLYPNQTPSKSFLINADGTGETEVNVPFYTNIEEPDLISTDGKGVLAPTGYFAIINNGVFDERNSFNILLNEDKDQTKFMDLILSNDAKKAAFVQTTTANRKYEIRIKNVVKDAPVSTVLYTVNILAEANDQAPKIHFVNGSKNILMSYGKFTSPKGSPNDYTYCEIIDTTTGKVTQSWKFMGDNVYRPTSD